MPPVATAAAQSMPSHVLLELLTAGQDRKTLIEIAGDDRSQWRIP
jgi:hypothetical protein